MAKQRQHNEYFRTVSLGGRKSCPSCYKKLLPNESIWSWGQYVRAKWNTVKYFCRECFDPIRADLNEHTGGCGCVVNLIGYRGEKLPLWLTLTDTACQKAA
jgi:hypothetical protein